ncbi:MAG: Patched family protein [Candidatus Magnetoglobus multicellularis str. Araruama]|uniref:Patched family protein n=1 Tax=Candidatus Magnetoglobus multicellularis str. Araruama TaxID=890399 RepID=A0A1V1P215_9BACT|nr:MAG: Patched family protein [Candidatus Magnetoglobus multicellularis str. Araruama]
MIIILHKTIFVLTEKRAYVLFGLTGIALFLCLFLTNITIDNSLEVWFLQDDPVLLNYNEFKDIYGNDEVIIAWVNPKGSIYEKKFVSVIYSICQKMEEYSLINRIVSITKAPYLDSHEMNLIVEDMVNKEPDDSFRPEELKSKILSNPLWEKLILNADQSSILILIEPVAGQNMDAERPQIIAYVKNALKHLNYKLAGMGVVYEELNRISLKDTSLFSSLAYILLISALFIFFRRISILIAATLTIIYSSLIFLGIFGLCGQSFNMFSAILPTLIIILCLADIIHVFSHYDKTEPGPDRLQKTLSFVLVPCLFTTVTTGIGFSALISSPMAVLKSFGMFACLGVFLAYFVSIIFSAALLARQGQTSNSKSSPIGTDFLDRLIEKISAMNYQYHKWIVFAGALIVCFSVYAISTLEVDTFSMNFLLDSNPVKQDSYFFEKDYGYYVPLEVRLRPRHPDGVKNPDFLKKLSHLQKQLDNVPNLAKSTSIADIVKQLNKVLTDNRQASYRIPDTKAAVAQELLLYEMDSDNDISYFVDSMYTEARLTIRIPMESSKEMEEKIHLVKSKIKAMFHDTVEIKFGGYIPLYVKMMDYIMQSQIRSFMIAFIVIFAIIGLLFRSFTVILTGIIPNILPIFFTLGFMGITGINLDIATVTIAAIAIGISVDDSIHFIFMYKTQRRKGLPIKEAVDRTLKTSGKAIITTSLLLITGYLVMIFASVKSVIFFGLLIGISMVSALICDLVLLPSVLLLFAKAR